MKIREFITYLETLPEETEIYVVVTSSHGYMGMSAGHVPLEVDGNTEVLDMRDNELAKGKSYENDISLYLGET